MCPKNINDKFMVQPKALTVSLDHKQTAAQPYLCKSGLKSVSAEMKHRLIMIGCSMKSCLRLYLFPTTGSLERERERQRGSSQSHYGWRKFNQLQDLFLRPSVTGFHRAKQPLGFQTFDHWRPSGTSVQLSGPLRQSRLNSKSWSHGWERGGEQLE